MQTGRAGAVPTTQGLQLGLGLGLARGAGRREESPVARRVGPSQPLTWPRRPVHAPRAGAGVAGGLRGARGPLPRAGVLRRVVRGRRTAFKGPLAPPVIGEPVVHLLCAQARLQGQVLLPQNSTASSAARAPRPRRRTPRTGGPGSATACDRRTGHGAAAVRGPRARERLNPASRAARDRRQSAADSAANVAEGADARGALWVGPATTRESPADWMRAIRGRS